MKEKSLDNKLNGEFLDSINYISNMANKYKADNNSSGDFSHYYDKLADVIQDKDTLERSLDYFYRRKGPVGNKFHAIGLLLDFAKHGMPKIDLYDFIRDAAIKFYGRTEEEMKEWTPLEDIPKEKTIDYIISQNEPKKLEVYA